MLLGLVSLGFSGYQVSYSLSFYLSQNVFLLRCYVAWDECTDLSPSKIIHVLIVKEITCISQRSKHFCLRIYFSYTKLYGFIAYRLWHILHFLFRLFPILFTFSFEQSWPASPEENCEGFFLVHFVYTAIL